MKKDRRSSAREVRALLWLLPLLAIASWLVWETRRPHTPKEIIVPSEVKVIASASTRSGEQSVEEEIAASAKPPRNDETVTPKLFSFDPNTIEYHDLVRLGFSRGEALGIIKYREQGKVFQIPEDLAACYQVTEQMYLRLRPFIIIGERYRLKPFERRGGSDPVFRQRDADGVPTEDAREGIVQSVQTRPSGKEVQQMRLDHEKPLVELNSADSVALVGVSGIGALTAGRIVEYRARLGGFARAEQLAEVRGMTEQNFERIVTQIFVDTLAIKKININFAPAKSLAGHPYIRPEALRKLLKQRQLKGGWRTAPELQQENIFTPQEFTQLEPYLDFN